MDNVVVRVGNSDVTAVSQVRNLGVTFDPAMNMQPHVRSVCRSGYAQLRNIGHIRRYLTDDATKSLVNGLVTSRLDYCNILLSGLPQATMIKLQRVQNTAARIISRTSRHEHITPTLRELHWLPVQPRVQYKLLVTTYKALNGLAPGYVTDMLSLHHPTRALRSADSTSLSVPRVRTVNYGDRQFRCASARQWNALPVDIRETSTLPSFQRLLKTHLFNAHFVDYID